MPFETIEIHKESRVGVLTLNRPQSLNAINKMMKAEVREGYAALMADPEVLAVVIHGNGRAFSAGFDLKESSQSGPTEGNHAWHERLKISFDFIMQFWEAPKPSIAAVHGYCIAGAMELAMACDMIIAEEGTRFGEPEVRFGSGIVAMLLPWMTTPKFAAELLLTGTDELDAARAAEMGLVNHVTARGDSLPRAMDYARMIAAADPDSVRLTRRAMQRSLEIAGLRAALDNALEFDVLIEGTVGEQKKEFNRIRKEDGLKAALAWRDAKFKKS